VDQQKVLLLVGEVNIDVMKKLTKKQNKIAKAAKPYNKITGADFKSLKKRKKK